MKCDNPCDLDPCDSKKNGRNTCEPYFALNDTLCPTSWQCTCSGFGWVSDVSTGGHSCFECADPCRCVCVCVVYVHMI